KGHRRHRQSMADWLAAVGTPAAPDSIVLTAGAQQALSISIAATTKPGDVLLTEELTYSGMKAIANQAHLKVRGVPLDGEVIRPDALEAACRATRARVLYCMPRLHNPTSTVMPERRRRQVAALAEKYRLTVIEDDVYGFLSPERASLAALIPERTICVSSVWKSRFPGMRLGCVVPPAGLLEKLSAAVWTTTICVPPISADLLCGWMDDGTALRILEWKRHEVAARQTMVKRLLGA